MLRHDKLADYVLENIESNGNVLKAFVFGSYARGEEKWGSDVDFLLVVNDSTQDAEIRNIVLNLSPDDYTLPELDITVYRESNVAKDSFFLSQVKKDWRLVYEKLS